MCLAVSESRLFGASPRVWSNEPYRRDDPVGTVCRSDVAELVRLFPRPVHV